MSIHYVSRCVSFTPEKSLRTRARARRSDGKPLTTLEPLFRCAIEVQSAMVERNAGVPAERRIEFRIGIHLGDVVEEADGDLIGDGVNIAARLEGISQSGAICLSEDAHRQVRARLDLEVNDLGQKELKNIVEPVRVYSLRVGLLTESKPATTVDAANEEKPAPRLALPDRPSIAVMPFVNMSGDTEQEYFADGITEDLITALSRIRWFFVIARNSCFAYKGQSSDVRDVARRLGVAYVLEGSVRKAGNRVRITAQLIDGGSGNHVWAQRYDRDLADIFAVQDEITSTLVGAIEPELGKAERERARAKRPDDLRAWDLYQRGLWHAYKRTREDLAEAQHLFRQAIEIELVPMRRPRRPFSFSLSGATSTRARQQKLTRCGSPKRRCNSTGRIRSTGTPLGGH
jgi:adenylate cyclase